MGQGDIHLRGIALREQKKELFDSIPKAKGYTRAETIGSYIKMGIFVLELPLIIGCLVIELVKIKLQAKRQS